ncbi:hypothetical protein L9F63_025876, partial [Diploptera punctata]
QTKITEVVLSLRILANSIFAIAHGKYGIGQCGNQIGSDFWPLVLQEHGAVCIDMEDSVVARFRTGQLRNLFDNKCLLTNYPGSGNNWAEGFYTHGNEYREKITNILRQRYWSGLGSATLNILEDNFPHIERFVTCVYPAGNEDVITAPYNVILATRELTEHASCVFPVDNKALLEICSSLKSSRDSQGIAGYIAKCKPFQDMNSIVVNMLLHLTSGSRFPGSLNVDMNEIYTNMVPFPNLHYISSSLSPLMFPTSNTSIFTGKPIKPDDLFSCAWMRDNQLLKVNPLGGTVLGATVVGRGSISMTDMLRNTDRFRNKVKFAPWSCNNSIKIGLCSVPPPGLTASVLSLVNTSNMSSLFKDLIRSLHLLTFIISAHTHHYLQVPGFENEDFVESFESLLKVEEEYSHITKMDTKIIPRLELL